ncbi:Rho-binding antiterminator [Solemya velesiana gill symbiont]|uniref:Transcriptional antiterminator, Rof n=1 Tax=Solemya velesiana gill symbiont TaxID=1918948 RepID=A0A1T2KYT0_9GAMM|nr:Rho-binding antiterminator [Solemya velesiana gill symbiont]OOZ37876.1 hypothetical protein BOW51_00255 [Solemya velesiana gill symbiont]
MTDYKPIPCALHSQYELLAMHRTPVRVTLAETGNSQAGIIIDITARNGVEHLVLQCPEGETELRLDNITEISEIDQ